ncbi:hypothetical protein [Mycetocola sp. JXN-3]|uniref:hypothetical protein n=1 Tax=Mycetocola sp. JXN-3 TaxID=2116510 RepID=UPI00165D24AA|nr:hypothetical protein [Mycetocola sp. JXN-3]
MKNSHDLPRWVRFSFGAPRLWTGFAWIGFVACLIWFGLAASNIGSLVFAGMGCVFGVVVIAIALHDRKYGLGGYRGNR